MKTQILLKKISNIAIFICGIALVLEMFFRKYVANSIGLVFGIGAFAFAAFAVTEIIKYVLKY